MPIDHWLDQRLASAAALGTVDWTRAAETSAQLDRRGLMRLITSAEHDLVDPPTSGQGWARDARPTPVVPSTSRCRRIWGAADGRRLGQILGRVCADDPQPTAREPLGGALRGLRCRRLCRTCRWILTLAWARSLPSFHPLATPVEAGGTARRTHSALLTRYPVDGIFRPVAGVPAYDRRRVRHEATKEEILAAAWELARTAGLTGFSLRDLALAVHMRHQSLYTYFPSKHAIYDALFAQGMRALVDQRAALALDRDPIQALRQAARAFVAFCVEDPVRYQLVFERVVPDFVPSEASMQLSAEALSYLEDWHGAAGLTDPADVDLWRAVLTGLAGQQIANDPGGTRWTKLVDRAIDGLLGTARHPGRKRATVRGTRRTASSPPKEVNR